MVTFKVAVLCAVYNVSGLLIVARQGGPGLAQTRKSTARAFHWPSLPVCGWLATFNSHNTLYCRRSGDEQSFSLNK